MVKVKNLHNTSGKQPKGYDTWLEFWEGKTGKTASKRPLLRRIIGDAHVQGVS